MEETSRLSLTLPSLTLDNFLSSPTDCPFILTRYWLTTELD